MIVKSLVVWGVLMIFYKMIDVWWFQDFLAKVEPVEGTSEIICGRPHPMFCGYWYEAGAMVSLATEWDREKSMGFEIGEREGNVGERRV